MSLPAFQGEIFMVQLVWRGPDDPHVAVRIKDTDGDGIWHHVAELSSGVLDDLIQCLQSARYHCYREAEPCIGADGKQYGWKFRRLEEVPR